MKRKVGARLGSAVLVGREARRNTGCGKPSPPINFGGGTQMKGFFAVCLTAVLLAALVTGCQISGGGANPGAVNLGTAGNYVILAKSGIDSATTSSVTGDLGLSPADSTYITGFGLIADTSNVYATSSQVTGRVYAADYTAPTPSNLTTAVGDMETAYTDAAGRAADVTELGDGDISGLTLARGVYKWGTSVLINTNVTLSGGPNDVWIFQIAGNLTMAGAKTVVLSGGARPENVFWQVAGGAGVTLGAGAHFAGIVLAQTAINVGTTAAVNGRLFAQAAVNIDASTVTKP